MTEHEERIEALETIVGLLIVLTIGTTNQSLNIARELIEQLGDDFLVAVKERKNK